jgi:hypothetical protein
MWKGIKKKSIVWSDHLLYEVITSYESQEWILSYHNIVDFWSVKNLYHSPYQMIMNSLYLLKFLVEWFFWHGKWCDAITTNENNFEIFLKTINWDIQWNKCF